MGDLRFGTCSWTDKTLIDSELFYPKKSMSAEDRLRFYAQHFNTVEVDSTYYALPSEKVVGLHTDRTPKDFIIHYKAFGLLTGHGIDPTCLPRIIRDRLSQEIRECRYVGSGQIPGELKDLAWQMFEGALRPAYSAGKLGVVLFQFPPHFACSEQNFEYILECRERLSDYRLAVEFRNPTWIRGENMDSTMGFLRDNALSYVSVDEPQLDDRSTMPPIAEATTDIAYVRFHGRNAATWRKKGINAAQRFAYLYNDDELNEWLPKIRKLVEMSNDTFVMMNNCFADYAIKNAVRMSELMGI